jgi:excisionase family DNA binding protein
MKLALSINEASKSIGLGTTNLRKLVKAKIIPSYKLGKKIMIPVKDLEDYINKIINNQVEKKQ